MTAQAERNERRAPGAGVCTDFFTLGGPTLFKKLTERLDALDEASAAIRAKADSRSAGKLDSLVAAECLIYVDKIATHLAKLERQLQAGLYDGEGECMR